MENKKGPFVYRKEDKELDDIVSYEVKKHNVIVNSKKFPYKHFLEKDISKTDIRPYILHLLENDVDKTLKMKMSLGQFAIIKVEEYLAKRFKVQYTVIADICEEIHTFVG